MENPRNTGMGSAIMNRINEFRMQHTKAFVALVVVLALMGLGGCSSALGNNSSSDSANQQAALSAGVLSFTVEADQWDSATDGSIAVRITGESDDGSSVFEQCNVVPGEAHETTLGAGEYEVALVDGKATQGNRYFAAPVVTVSFDGTTDKNAVLQMKLDAAKKQQQRKPLRKRPLRRKLQLKRRLPRKPLLKSKRKLKRNQLLNRRPLRDHWLQAIVPNQRKRCILPQVVKAKNIIPIRLVAR